MSFTDGKPRIVTETECNARWSFGKPGEFFRCAFCGHKFIVGDSWRFLYTNDIPEAGGNPLVCKDCDAPDKELRERWKAMCEEFKTRFWWFARR